VFSFEPRCHALPGRRLRHANGVLSARRNLPRGRMWIAKPDVDLQASRQFGVAGHLRSAITGHRPAQCHGQPFHLPGEAFEGGAGGAAVRSALQSIPRIDCLTLELPRMTYLVLRSTTVPTAERLKAPLIRYPSQWPGTSRASMSSGRWIIRSVSGTIAEPAREVRRVPRFGLACRSASIISVFNPPRGCA